MKKFNIYVAIVIISLLLPNFAQAQFWKKIQKNIEKKINNEAESRVNRRTDKGIDNTFNAVEDGIDGKESNKVQVSQQLDGPNASTDNSNSVAKSTFALFNSLDMSSLEKDKFVKEPYNYAFIVLSDKNGNIVPKQGDVYVYKTSEGNLGKFEIVSVDKFNNYRTTFRYVTYNKDGSIRSQSNSLSVDGTYNIDFDNGSNQPQESNADFKLSRVDDNYTEIIGAQEGIMIKLYDKGSDNK